MPTTNAKKNRIASNIGPEHAPRKRGRGRATAVLLALLGLLLLAPAAPAAEAPSGISPAQARQALEVLTNPALRAQTVTALEAIARLHPAAAAPAPTRAAAPKPAPAPAAAKPAPAAKSKVQLNPDSLGAAVVNGVPGFLGGLWQRALASTRRVQDLPLLWGWLVVLATNPLARSILTRAVWRVAIAFAAGLVVERLLRWLLSGAVARLAASAPAPAGCAEITATPEPEPEPGSESDDAPPAPAIAHRRRIGSALLLGRIPLAFGRLVLDLLPVLGFAVAAHVVAATPIGGDTQDRLIVLAMADAYVIAAVIMAFARMLLQPDRPGLRLLRMSDRNAVWLTVWIRRLVVVTVFGFAIAQVALALGMATGAYRGLLKVDGLINHAILAIMVVQKRRAVAKRIRAPAEATGPIARLRNAFAPLWHWFALLIIAGTWIAWALEATHGYLRVLRFAALLLVVLVAARIVAIVLLGVLERTGHIDAETAAAHPDWEARLRVYQPVVQGTARFVVYVGALVILLELWGVPIFAWFGRTEIGHRLAAGLGTLFVTLVVSVAIWEAVNAGFRAHLARLTATQHAARAARLNTLLPLLRTALFVAILVIAGLTVLSQIGINIGPLLAGAGIVGVAIGFGSQKLVQDLITGIFLLLENAMQVGDWVTVSNLSGKVEALSVRTIRLRAGDGSVHIIPFSAVTSVTNVNRGLGNASVNVTVAFDANIDQATALLTEVAAGMRADPEFGDKMLSEFQLWGVDKVDGAGVTILGQIVCVDTGRWPVQREFNRRMKIRFEDEAVPLYNPQHSYLLPTPPTPALPSRQRAGAGGGE